MSSLLNWVSKQSVISASSQVTPNWERMVNMLWRSANQSELNKLEKWVEKYLTMFNKCEEFHMVVEARGRVTGNHLCIVDLSVLADKKLKRSQQCGLEGNKVNCIVGHCSNSSDCKLREVIIHLYSALVRPHLEYHVYF